MEIMTVSEVEHKEERCFKIQNGSVRVFVEDKVGVMGPAVFYADTKRPVMPYYISHWCGKPGYEEFSPHVRVLKGDFFCLPFGGNNKYLSHDYPCHGPGANGDWNLSEIKKSRLEMKMNFPDSPTNITKRILLKDGQNCIYQEHVVENCMEALPYGHHPILDCTYPLFLSTSPFKLGVVTRESDVDYLAGEYHALKGHAVFSSLDSIQTHQIDKPFADCSVFPARDGYVDIIQLFNREDLLAWTTASCPKGGYLWYAFKNPTILPSTLFWMENRGRHFRPWDGRNCCIGIEDVCSCFADGAAVSSVGNELSDRGLPTCRQFRPDEAFVVRHIQGVVRIPNDFGKVVTVTFDRDASIATFIDANGQSVVASVDATFLS
jgi:hypothetical protein